jgi:hypothetical protein
LKVNGPWVLPEEIFLSVKEPESGKFTGYFLAKTLQIVRRINFKLYLHCHFEDAEESESTKD